MLDEFLEENEFPYIARDRYIESLRMTVRDLFSGLKRDFTPLEMGVLIISLENNTREDITLEVLVKYVRNEVMKYGINCKSKIIQEFRVEL
jgi:hypothetical protein